LHGVGREDVPCTLYKLLKITEVDLATAFVKSL
jgi:hypothetical protein